MAGGLEQQTNKNYTIKSIEYTRHRLIMSQAIGNQRVLKFLSSGWDMFVGLCMAQAICHRGVSFFRRQVVQARCFTQHTAPEEPLSQHRPYNCVIEAEKRSEDDTRSQLTARPIGLYELLNWLNFFITTTESILMDVGAYINR